MKWKQWLASSGMNSLKIKAPYLEMEWQPRDADKDAAWDMYVELLTRITTQRLPESDGDEKTALDSVFSLFAITRATIKNHGRECKEFIKLAVIVLNQVIRPFTAKWHRRSLAGAFDRQESCWEFRDDLEALQGRLLLYSRMLAEMAGVEDLTDLQA